MCSTPKRLDRLAQSFDKLEIDLMLVTNEINVRYLSGFTGDSSYLLVAPESTSILSDGRYDAQIATQCGGIEAIIRPPSQLLPDLALETLRAVKPSGNPRPRIGLEADDLSMSAYQFLVDGCPSVEFVATSGVVERFRMIKDEREIEITRRAVDVAERAFQSLLPMLTPSWSERQIAHELEAKMRFLGAEGCSFSPIVAVGPAGALPHYEPGATKLENTPSLLIDWGADLDGYASDLTRTLHQESAGAEFRNAYQAVLDAQLAAIATIADGISAREVDRAAREVLKKAGLDDAFKHGLGHGVGLEIHESPRMSSISEETLKKGMIITVEPGVYFDGDFGIRIEDDVLVTDSGCEVLSQLPKGLDDCRLML